MLILLYTLLLAYFSISLIIAVLTYGIFLYEIFNHPEDTIPHAFDTVSTQRSGNPPQQLTRRLGLTCLRCMAQSVLATYSTPLFYPLGLVLRLHQRFLGARARKNAHGKPPVVFIHGLYHNESAWVFLRPRAKKAGYTRAFLFHYRCLGNNLDAIVKKLDATLRRLEQDWNGERPILVGHSMGGLVIRHFLAQAGNAQRISGVVTLATPHWGSRLGSMGIGRLAHELAFEGPQFHMLCAQEHMPDIPCHAIYSTYDNQVVPQRALLPPPGWTSEQSRPLSHVVVLWNKNVARLVIHAMNRIISGT